MPCVAVFVFQAFVDAYFVFEEHRSVWVRILDKESKGTELRFGVKFRRSCKRYQSTFPRSSGCPPLSLGLECSLGGSKQRRRGVDCQLF